MKCAQYDQRLCFFALVTSQSDARRQGGSFEKCNFMQLLLCLSSLGQFSTILANSAN